MQDHFFKNTNLVLKGLTCIYPHGSKKKSLEVSIDHLIFNVMLKSWGFYSLPILEAPQVGEATGEKVLVWK